MSKAVNKIVRLDPVVFKDDAVFLKKSLSTTTFHIPSAQIDRRNIFIPFLPALNHAPCCIEIHSSVGSAICRKLSKTSSFPSSFREGENRAARKMKSKRNDQKRCLFFRLPPSCNHLSWGEMCSLLSNTALKAVFIHKLIHK